MNVTLDCYSLNWNLICWNMMNVLIFLAIKNWWWIFVSTLIHDQMQNGFTKWVYIYCFFFQTMIHNKHKKNMYNESIKHQFIAIVSGHNLSRIQDIFEHFQQTTNKIKCCPWDQTKNVWKWIFNLFLIHKKNVNLKQNIKHKTLQIVT